jgi:hypothetical protein
MKVCKHVYKCDPGCMPIDNIYIYIQTHTQVSSRIPSQPSGIPQYAQPIDDGDYGYEDEEYMDEQERAYMMQQMQNEQQLRQRAAPTKSKVPGQGENCPWAQVCVYAVCVHTINCHRYLSCQAFVVCGTHAYMCID